MVGINKRTVFSDIKDKVWKRISGRRKGLFSAGGTEILIKAVLQVVPSYLISIFQLPICLCNELKSLLLNFWWGGGQGERKIAWRSWAKVCLPKGMGGLGFKDLYLFNKSLMAKQAWRLIKNPSSLAGRIVGDKYFPASSFLRAKKKDVSSYLWHNILWERELIEKGIRWSVGNGVRINCFENAWLPRPISFKPFTKNEFTPMAVRDLFLIEVFGMMPRLIGCFCQLIEILLKPFPLVFCLLKIG